MSKDKSQDKQKAPKKAKKYSIPKAIFGTVLAAIIFVAFPYVMLNYVIPQGLIEKAVSGLVIDWTNIIPLLERWLMGGVGLVVLAFFVWLLPKGSKGRLLASALYAIYAIVWVVYVINFGDMSNLITVTYNGNVYSFGIVLQGLLYLMIFFKALKLLTIYATYKDNREHYLRKTGAA